MRSTNILKSTYPLAMLVMLHVNTVVAAERGLNLSVRLLGGGWSGENTTSKTEFESTQGGQLGLNMAYQNGKFYTGLNLQGGEFTFEKQSPDQVGPSGTKQVTDDKVTHNELDLVFGYYLTDHISLFFDIKGVSDTWQSNQHQQEFGGAGLGVAGYWPINSNWILFGSFGAISNGNIKYNGEKIGEGTARSLDMGILYRLTDNHRLLLGLKSTRYAYKYDAGDEQVHNIGGGYIGYNYAFEL